MRAIQPGLTDPSTFNPLTANITYIPSDYHSGRVQSWFASVQREVGPNMLLDLAYVGNRADGLVLIGNYNQATPNNAAGTVPLQSRRPIPEFSDITYVFNGGKSRYDAFQAKYEWRLRADMSVLTSLTLSKAKDNGAQSLENQNGNFPGPQDFYNLEAEYGTGAYDQPYNSTTSFVWALPFGHGHRWGANFSPVMEALAGGWKLAGINTVTAGEPVTLTYSPRGDVRGVRHPAGLPRREQLPPERERAIRTRPPASSRSPTGSTRTAWWCRPIPASRSATRRATACAARTSGASTSPPPSRSPLASDVKLEFRVEAFNLFNRDNFAPPNGNRSSGAFGTITSTYDPRQVQLGVKILW